MARHRAWIRLENGDHVARMVEVAVREADEVRLPRGFEFRRADGVFLEPGVDVDGLAAVGFDQKRRLSMKNQPGAHVFAMPPKCLIYEEIYKCSRNQDVVSLRAVSKSAGLFTW